MKVAQLHRYVRILALSAGAMTLAPSSDLHAWGAKGHELVTLGAAELSTSCLGDVLRRHGESLAFLSNVPDTHWRSGPGSTAEKPTHFFHWDNYASTALGQGAPIFLEDALRRFGSPFLEDNGSALWRIGRLYSQLVRKLKDADWPAALQTAGILSHYVGDMAQPMHASTDYDGQSIGRRGVHSYFETRLVNAVEKRRLLGDLLREGSESHPELEPEPGMRGEMAAMSQTLGQSKSSNEDLSDVLQHFDQDSQDDRALTRQLAPLMGRGAAALARLWDMAAEQAGLEPSQMPTERFTLDAPEWMPL